MKHTLNLLFICLTAVIANAQSSIKGKVFDEKQKPVRGANVLLLQQKDSSLVLSAITGESGAYLFANVRNGVYYISVNMLGFKKTYIRTTMAATDIDIADTKLVPAAVSLGEVTVTSTKPFLEQRADKLVVNVEGSATAAGATALEVLQKVPGVIIMNDQIRLSGKSSVTIMIDGKTSQYTDISQVLGALSAANIEKIELITNPGAKYDAAGGAIINIIIKKNANLGTNGTVSLSGGMGLYTKGKEGIDRNYYRLSPFVSLNHRKGKLNTYGSFSFLHRNQYQYSEFDRVIAPNRFFQTNYSPNNRNSYNYRAGADFYADKKNTFGILIRGFDFSGIEETINATQQIKASTGDVLSAFRTLNNTTTKRNNLAANINWKHNFDTTGKELNIDFDFSRFQLNNNSDITNQLSSGSYYVNNQFVDNPVKFGVFKLDYSNPFDKDTKLDIGTKTSLATINNYLIFQKSNVIDPSRSTDFEYTENINAVYANFQKKLDKWEFITGLRAEQTIAKGKSVSVDVLSRNYWQLFPSAFLTRRIDKNFATTIQYSRRVDRPAYQQQNPFIQYLDSLTYTRGNPLLRPELTDAYKLSVTYQNQPFFSVSYNKTKDVIFNDAPKQEGNLTYTTPENLAAFENIIFELNFPLDFGKKISGFGGNQFIYNHYKADYLGSLYNRSKWNWQAYWQVSFKPKSGWNFEVSGFYTTRQLNEFIEVGELGSLNFAIQKTFLEKKARISLNFNDILFSQKTSGSIQYQDINVAFRQLNESRNVRLAFSYSFGNQKLKATRNRNTASDAEASRVKTN